MDRSEFRVRVDSGEWTVNTGQRKGESGQCKMKIGQWRVESGEWTVDGQWGVISAWRTELFVMM